MAFFGSWTVILEALLLRLRSAKPSEPQKARSRFLWRNAPKELRQNIAVNRRAAQEDVDSDYLFGNAQR
jgi:hypothetical protein